MRPKAVILSILVASLSTASPAQPSGSAAVFSNIKSAIEALLKWLKPDRVDAFTDARFKDVNDRALEVAIWSKAKGVLLQVNVARSNADPNYKVVLGDQPVILGPGKDIVDAAASAPDAYSAGVPDGYKYSLDDSYYVWATVDGSGAKLKYQPQFAEATRHINGLIKEELARRTVDASARKLANRAIVDGMMKHYESLQKTASSRKDARKLRDDLNALQQRLDKIESDLKAELDRQARLQKAAQTVDRLAAVLQFATVLSSTLSTISSADRPNVENAKTFDELKQALSNALTDAASEVQSASAASVTTKQELGLRQQNIRVLLESNGAPKLLTIQTLSPTP